MGPFTPAMKAPVLIALLLAARVATDSPLPLGRPQAEGFHRERLQRVFDLVEGTVQAGQHAGAGMLVARHGKLIGQRSFGVRDADTGAPMEADTICRIYSMTKAVTSVAVLQLVEQGRINLGSPTTNWLPELRSRASSPAAPPPRRSSRRPPTPSPCGCC